MKKKLFLIFNWNFLHFNWYLLSLVFSLCSSKHLAPYSPFRQLRTAIWSLVSLQFLRQNKLNCLNLFYSVLHSKVQSIFFYRATGLTSPSHCRYKAGTSFTRELEWLLFWKNLKMYSPKHMPQNRAENLHFCPTMMNWVFWMHINEFWSAFWGC